MSHNIYNGKRINGGFLRAKWPPILGCFCAVMGGGPLITIDLHFHVHARAFQHTLQNYPAAPIPIKPTRSVGWGDIGGNEEQPKHSPKKTPDMPGSSYLWEGG